MGLSNESPTNAAATEQRLIEFAKARGTARALAKQMILYERNPDPMREREAPNPAHGVRIRRVVPMLPVDFRIEVTEECKRHNQAVCDLRKPE
jgi:hypothetical protein